jgi:hypothetical protein
MWLAREREREALPYELTAAFRGLAELCGAPGLVKRTVKGSPLRANGAKERWKARGREIPPRNAPKESPKVRGDLSNPKLSQNTPRPPKFPKRFIAPSCA